MKAKKPPAGLEPEQEGELVNAYQYYITHRLDCQAEKGK